MLSVGLRAQMVNTEKSIRQNLGRRGRGREGKKQKTSSFPSLQ